MAFDSFLFFGEGPTKIVGETTDSTYPGSFEISEFSFGVETTLNISSSTQGAGAGKATFKEFTVKKQTDSASPALLVCLGTGSHYKTVNLFIRKAGGAAAGSSASDKKAGKAYLIFAFGVVAVKSIEWAGSTGDDVASETVIFEYGEMYVGYYKQNPNTGKLENPSFGGWSKLNNSAAPKNVGVNSVNTDLKCQPGASPSP